LTSSACCFAAILAGPVELAADDTLTRVSGLGPTSFIKEFKLGQKLLERGSALDLKALAQPEIQLKSLLRS
jgi:hypothetical protein